MKQLLICIIILVLYSCNRYEILDVPERGVLPISFGKVKFKYNGVKDSSFLPFCNLYNEGILNQNYGLMFNWYDVANFKRVELSFRYFYFKPSTYNIKRTTRNYNLPVGNETLSILGNLASGGDAVEDYYLVDSTKPCVLNITRVDSTTKELWGTFEGTYAIKLPKKRASAPDTVKITEGEFHTKVE